MMCLSGCVHVWYDAAAHLRHTHSLCMFNFVVRYDIHCIYFTSASCQQPVLSLPNNFVQIFINKQTLAQTLTTDYP